MDTMCPSFSGTRGRKPSFEGIWYTGATPASVFDLGLPGEAIPSCINGDVFLATAPARMLVPLPTTGDLFNPTAGDP